MPGLALADTPPLGCCAEETVAPAKTMVPPEELFAFKQSQDRLRLRLTQTLLKLFKELTGLPLHVLWHEAMDFRDPDHRPVLCPVARQTTAMRSALSPGCDKCLRQRWKADAPASRRPGQFLGRCGARCLSLSLQVGIRRPATLVLRAEDSGAHFDRAALLLRWIHHQLGLTFEAGQLQQEIANAHHRIRALETEAARLHEELHRRIPEVPQDEAQSLHVSHRQQIVRAMLDYLQVHYRQPLHLDEMAGVLKMNANYLSSLFSETTGVSFHDCLTEIRLARARERLRDPTARVCEVAATVGYASADQFTRAFKAHTGLSPRSWREADDGRLPAPPGAGLDI